MSFRKCLPIVLSLLFVIAGCSLKSEEESDSTFISFSAPVIHKNLIIWAQEAEDEEHSTVYLYDIYMDKAIKLENLPGGITSF